MYQKGGDNMTLKKWIEYDPDEIWVRRKSSAAIPIDKIPDSWFDYQVESVDRHIKDDGTYKEVITVWTGIMESEDSDMK